MSTPRNRSTFIHQQPIQFTPDMAVLIGVNAAIVIQKLHFLLQHPDNGREIDGEKWIYNTYQEWRDKYFPFWSIATIERTFAQLESAGLVASIQPEGRASRRKFYRVTEAGYSTLATKNLPEDLKLRDSGEPIILMDSGRPQIEGFEDLKLRDSYIDNKNSNKTNRTEESATLLPLPSSEMETTKKRKGTVNGSKPEQREIEDFAEEIGLPRSDGRAMFFHFEEKGWKGIKNWQMTIRKWKAFGYLPSQKRGTSAPDAGKPAEKKVIRGY